MCLYLGPPGSYHKIQRALIGAFDYLSYSGHFGGSVQENPSASFESDSGFVE